ncbi:MAG TPA: hypothetical protein VFV34_18335 [Blastocatellia bacterium]|nr:hypothetical protein [Blastocatellia bacterium]
MGAGHVTRFSYEELNLLVFTLEGCPDPGRTREAPSCEDSCPAIPNLETLFAGEQVSPEERLAHHLTNHLREGMVECGMLDLAMPAGSLEGVDGDNPQVGAVNERLRQWSCEISLNDSEIRVLTDALGRLPRSAWLSMPRFLWRLRKRLKRARNGVASTAE